MRILFFVLSAFLLSSCSYLQGQLSSDESQANSLTQPTREDCAPFPYDNSDSPCNLLGWQSFAYQSLMQTKKEHSAALALLTNETGDEYKKLILLSSYHQSIDVRNQATAAMFSLSKNNLNGFGQFFYALALYNERELNKQKNTMDLKAKLRKLSKQNNHLESELNNAQSKIQAIMDIEKDINTN